MAGKRKVYTPEFKLSAVKMLTEQKLSVAEVARRLGVTENRLHNWKKALATKGVAALTSWPGSCARPESLRKPSASSVSGGSRRSGSHAA